MFTQFHEQIEAFAKQYHSSLTDEMLEQKVISACGYAVLSDPQKKAEAIQDIRNQALEIANKEIGHIQSLVKQKIKDIKAESEGAIVNATTGAGLVLDYAKSQGIDKDAAIAKLEDYVKIKKTAYNPELIADQYAALRNKEALQRAEDRAFAAKVYDEQMIRFGAYAKRDQLQSLESIANKAPVALLNEVNTSGWGINKQLYSA